MDYLQALILSIVEGITEFLPISSTGHLNLARVLLHIPNSDFFATFEIFIQLGAILAIALLYWKTAFTNIEGWKRVIAAFIPTAIIGFILGKLIKHYLTSNEYITLIALLIGGILLIVLELLYKEKEHHAEKIEKITYTNAILIGVCQAIAVIPGVSRSAATILGAMFLGTKRKTAVEFSFLLAIPTMLAATVFDLKDANFSFSNNEYILLAIGFIGSFVVAIFAVKWLVLFIRTHTFIPFGIYRIILAILFWFLIIR
jgi:undecaprenyl-diphosphatase